MRIAHFACIAPPEVGGIGRVAYEEVTRLANRGHDATLYAPLIGMARPQYVSGLESRLRIGNGAVLDRRALKTIAKAADVVHLHYPFMGSSRHLAQLRKRGVIKRLVVTIHMDAKPNGVLALGAWGLRTLFQNGILDAADAIIVASKDYAAHASYAKFAEQAFEIPFGVDARRFAPGEADRGRLGIPHDAFVVSFVGGMDRAHAFKGVAVLLDALAKLPNVYAVLVGDGDERKYFEARAAALNIADRVKFLGRVSDEKLPSAYHLGNVFAFPSTSGAEAYGLVALEAEACGLPVVASDLPGVRTVVRNGQTGLLVPPRDVNALAAAIHRLHQNERERALMSSAARAHAQVLNWDRHIERLLDVYAGK